MDGETASAIGRWQTWVLSFLCWTLFAIFDAGGSYVYLIAAGSKPVLSNVILWNFSYAYVWVLVTPLIYEIAARFTFKRSFWKIPLAIHVLAGCLITFFVSALYIGWNTVLGLADITTPLKLRLIDLSLENLPRCFATMGVAHALVHHAKWREREAESARLETRLAQAQLELLRSQLEPHFLFNTLNSIATLTRKDPVSAERMTLQLASLLRASLDCTGLPAVPLRQELDFLKNYLNIQLTRFHDRLTVNLQVEPALLAAPVPSLILQPLVENAIRHGVAKAAGPGCIEIRATQQNESMRIEISDNGPGVSQPSEEGSGFGLRNTRARLTQLYGEHHEFRLENVPGQGCKVVLSIPISNTITRATP